MLVPLYGTQMWERPWQWFPSQHFLIDGSLGPLGYWPQLPIKATDLYIEYIERSLDWLLWLLLNHSSEFGYQWTKGGGDAVQFDTLLLEIHLLKIICQNQDFFCEWTKRISKSGKLFILNPCSFILHFPLVCLDKAGYMMYVDLHRFIML